MIHEIRLNELSFVHEKFYEFEHSKTSLFLSYGINLLKFLHNFLESKNP
jgi:hypothetical protein